jgi:WD40 repeat protein
LPSIPRCIVSCVLSSFPPYQNSSRYSYSILCNCPKSWDHHIDRKYLELLKVHLEPYVRSGQVEIWDDTKIQAGMDWSEAIRRALASAKVAILLISADYLASDFIALDELPPLLTAAQQEGTVILPIILKPCAFKYTELANFQTVNIPSRPLAKMPLFEREKLLATVAQYTSEALRTKQSPPLVSLSSETTLLTYEGHNRKVRSVAWSPDGQRIASGSEDTTVQVWNASSGDLFLTYSNHSHLVRCVGWSPNGLYIASGGNDGTVQVWDSSTGNHILTYRGHSDWVYAVAWSPDGNYIASCGVDQTIQIWNATTGSTIFTYLGHIDDVRSVAFSPDGGYIASGSEDGTAQIWDTAEGKKVQTFQSYTLGVNTVAWSHDGKYLASGSNDAIVQLWSIPKGDLFYTYRGHTDRVYSLTWSPDDQRIASGGSDATVQVWKIPYG